MNQQNLVWKAFKIPKSGLQLSSNYFIVRLSPTHITSTVFVKAKQNIIEKYKTSKSSLDSREKENENKIK